MQGIRWTPGIGDPTFMGWLTVAAYFCAAWLCLRVFKREAAAPAGRASLWLLLAVAMAALGVNKQLDLQSLVTDVGRVLAKRQGWYESRTEVQAVFVRVILALGVASVVLLWFLTRGQFREFRWVLLGWAFLVSFVLIRAASLHVVDRLIGTRHGGLRVNWVLELAGITLIGLGALLRLRRVPTGAKP